MKFKYLDRVKVSKGFYEGLEGTLIEISTSGAGYNTRYLLDYKIFQSNSVNELRWFNESELELMMK